MAGSEVDKVPPIFEKSLKEVQTAMADMECHLSTYFAVPQRDLQRHLSPLRRATVHVTLAQAVNVLFCFLLKARGIAMEDSIAKKEMERVRLYAKKVEAAVDKINHPKPTMMLDLAATNRFIESAIPDLTAEQRRKVRDLANQHRESRKRQAEGREEEGDEEGEGGEKEGEEERGPAVGAEMMHTKKKKKRNRQRGGTGKRDVTMAAAAFLAQALNEANEVKKGTGDDSDDDSDVAGAELGSAAP
ncbi:hypothetical protein CBR_g8579 [Chara braunii]|uniref:Nuclear nucleic acid-binding protein C1D n=1 Tax=Chara braunii TaxID=69332 RepID=A0A388JRX9_CHABU|nr:hypothetical protein CBR_g8579 [Chara braunii]|eukprot:GBG60556.1 hypothetical protein CBR_g8579 [Chara braunii]